MDEQVREVSIFELAISALEQAREVAYVNRDSAQLMEVAGIYLTVWSDIERGEPMKFGFQPASTTEETDEQPE